MQDEMAVTAKAPTIFFDKNRKILFAAFLMATICFVVLLLLATLGSLVLIYPHLLV